ncbi:hypothetical protein PAXRUDRAFT_825926 [Paxillus rubicundulus Ve08.2h10]|uniref:Unplaced genomic scaffold scaffold_163, whole genome shotgun sequence n=1 Tax=Paxillus rubicundulus Ve08.2h10 TaxID=930991 RepID=A0A0D0DFJ8_9AGAM|nr:hypothetical protein PAXRUDRAFT_825926 [Paxillus rubicundulus Ve08.2h10]
MLFRDRVGVHPLWCLAVLPHTTSALPLPSLPNGVITVGRYIPLIVISLCVFLVVIVFLGIKLLYMKHRRIGTIHSSCIVHSSPIDFSSDFHSSTTSMSSGPGVRVEYGVSCRGLLVGCFGSPRWETRLRPKLDQEAWRQQQRSSFMYQLHRESRGRSSRYYANPKPNNPSSSSRRMRSTSFFSFSSEASIDEESVTAMSFLPLRLPTSPGDSSRRPSQQKRSSWHCISDFGEPTRTRKLPEAYDSKIKRRTSQSSVRLVHVPGSGRVSYSFLSRLPPQSTLSSPFMGTRDSLQLSRHSLRYSRKPVPSLPPLPSYRPSILSRAPHHPVFDPLLASEYLPPLQFSPPTSITSVFHSRQPFLDEKVSNIAATRTNKVRRLTSPDLPSAERILDSRSDVVQTHVVTTTELPTGPFETQGAAVQKMNKKPKHKRSQSRNGPTTGASPLQLALIPNNTAAATSDKENGQSETATVLRTLSASSHSKSTTLKKPLKSSLRQGSVMSNHSVCSPDSAILARFTVTPSMSETSTRASSRNMGKGTDDQASLRTPVSKVDIGMLGLDRFHWNDESEELKVRPSHMKKDSHALMSFWEEGGWVREQEQRTDMDMI